MSEQIFSKKDIKGTVLNWSRYNFIQKKKKINTQQSLLLNFSLTVTIISLVSV